LDLQPGIYPLAEPIPAVNDIFARDGEMCELEEGHYESTGGALNLTASGTSFSGTFEFTAWSVRDHSKSIQVTGSFTNVSLNQ
jgi:hypothetical protein